MHFNPRASFLSPKTRKMVRESVSRFSHSDPDPDPDMSMSRNSLPPPPPLYRNLPKHAPMDQYNGNDSRSGNKQDDFYSDCHSGESTVIEETKIHPLQKLQENERKYMNKKTQTTKTLCILRDQCAEIDKKIDEWKRHYENLDFFTKIDEQMLVHRESMNKIKQQNEQLSGALKDAIYQHKKRSQMRGEQYDSNTIALKYYSDQIRTNESLIRELNEFLLALQSEQIEGREKYELHKLQHTFQELTDQISVLQTELNDHDKTLGFIRDLIDEELMVPRYQQYAIDNSLEYNRNDIYDLFLKVNTHYFQTLIQNVNKYELESLNLTMFDIKKINIDSTLESLVNVFFTIK